MLTPTWAEIGKSSGNVGRNFALPGGGPDFESCPKVRSRGARRNRIMRYEIQRLSSPGMRRSSSGPNKLPFSLVSSMLLKMVEIGLSSDVAGDLELPAPKAHHIDLESYQVR